LSRELTVTREGQVPTEIRAELIERRIEPCWLSAIRSTRSCCGPRRADNVAARSVAQLSMVSQTVPVARYVTSEGVPEIHVDPLINCKTEPGNRSGSEVVGDAGMHRQKAEINVKQMFLSSDETVHDFVSR
jgi:hypothetical protein